MSEKERFTSSNIKIPAYHEGYNSSNNKQNEKPGEFPFTRGVYSSMYRSKPWTMRQYAGFSTAKESNERYKELLSKGAKGLSVAFDLPTQMGYDSDDMMAAGEVGKVGVAIDNIDDMRELFEDIDLSKVSTSMTINSTSMILLLLYKIVAEEKGIDSKILSGTIQNDILKEYIARGTYVFPPKHSLKIITDIFDYCNKHIPKWNTISISGYHIREAGSTASQEIAFTLANAKTYVKAAIEAGLKVDDFAPRLSFFFNVHNNFLEEIAKFRAARRMWAKIMKNEFKTENKKSMLLRFHSQVAGSTLTAQQPMNNISRVSLQAMAAVLGGTQSLHTNSYDEALQLPSSKAAEIALRTQQIIQNETGIIDFVDPMAGSYAIEYLTDELEKSANEIILDIESRGGVIKCIEDGYIASQISESAYEYQKDIESESKIIVGLNKFKNEKEDDYEKMILDEKIETEKVNKLKKFKENRDMKIVSEKVDKLKKVSQTQENILYCIEECLKSKVTLGEICNVLREVYGKYQATSF